MRVGWYVVDNGTRVHPWSLEKRRHGNGGVIVGAERLKGTGGRTRRWTLRGSAQEAADLLNREEAAA